MSFRKAMISMAVLSSLLGGAAVRAAVELPYTAQAFHAAQHDGKPILVDIWASWCPVCKAQAPTISEIVADPAFKELVIYKVDFDAQKDVVREMGARMQSTLIVFHGAAEKGRSTGDTDPASIKALVGKAVH